MIANTPRPAVPWPVWTATIAATAAAMMFLWYGWCVFPLSYWNEVRLAPAFALRHGLTVYAPGDGGPLSTWIYGPLTPVLNLPATFASSATSAIETAGAINALLLVAPLALVVWTVGENRARPCAIRACALSLSVLLLPPNSLVFQVADNAAVACGLLSCWCLGRRGSSDRQPTTAAAAWCIAAICAKQSAVFLLVAHVIYLGLFADRSTVLRYVLRAGAFGSLAALGCCAYFGFGPLWFNLVIIPARLPWGDIMEKIVLRWPQLLAYVLLPLGLLQIWRRSKHWPDRPSNLGRSVRINALAFAALLPVGVLSFVKIGGDMNVFHSWYYLLPVFATAFVIRASASKSGGRWLIAATAAIVALRLPEFRNLPLGPLTAYVDQATKLAAVAPETAWFPNNPIVTFYSDGKIYHVEDGLATRHLAGLGIREVDFRRHLPARLSTIIYDAGFTSPFALQLLADFTVKTRSGQWSRYQRPPPSLP